MAPAAHRHAALTARTPHVRVSSMDATTTFVIVGGGLAGAKAAETLRDEGFDGRVVLISDEAERPYERPPLSKGYLLGNDERDVALRLEARVTALDRGAHEVEIDSGERVGYDKLLLTTGSEPRRLDVPG